MNEKQAIAALDAQVVRLTRKCIEQQEQIASLARTVAGIADATAQTLSGNVREQDAAGYLWGLAGQANYVMRRAS